MEPKASLPHLKELDTIWCHNPDCYPTTSLYSVTTQKTTAWRTSNINFYPTMQQRVSQTLTDCWSC